MGGQPRRLGTPVEIAPQVPRLAVGNLNFAVEVQAAPKAAIGPLVIAKESVGEGAEPVDHVVLGSLRIPRALPAELLGRKIARLQVMGSVRCPEENAAALRARLANGSGRMVVVPAGYVQVERPLVLDGALLGALPGSKLFCLAGLQIQPDVDAARLDAVLERLVANGLVLCPAALRAVLATKCDLLETQVVFYEGKLWRVGGEERLAASRVVYLEGQATLVIEGELTIDAHVEPCLLAERLADVHNLG